MSGSARAAAGGVLFGKKYTGLKNEIDAFLENNLPAFDAEGQKTLGEAMRYSVTAGGKRLRGVLAMAVSEMFDVIPELSRAPIESPSAPTRDSQVHDAVLTLAGALEYIHAYSLIHDDMPCMDDDDYRRGKPSCHKVYGEGMAMLAGDALLNLAFEILFEHSACESLISDSQECLLFAKAASYIARAAGAGGMAGGQAIDIYADAESEAQLIYMHKLKTGRLFDAAVLAPAMYLRAGAGDLDALRKFSGALGFAFQIKDDLSDAKSVDTVDEKRNYAALFGYSKAEQKLQELYLEAIGSLDGLSRNADFLRYIVNFISGDFN